MNRDGIQAIVENELTTANPSGPQLTDILSRGQRAGFHRMDIWDSILAVFSTSKVQQRWENWTQLDDREEIRLRLKVLLQCGSTDSALTDFITFFFRASDPVLYQLSAIILGRELNRRDDLRMYFEAYSSKRGIKPGEPVKLNNQRNRRRILLTTCAAAAFSDGEEVSSFELIEQPLNELTDSDISILFSSLSLLLQHEAGSNSIPYIISIIRQRFEQDKQIRDRNLVRNSGVLLHQLQQNGEQVGELFNLCFNRVLNQYNQAATFASRLQALLLMDELMESSVHLGLTFSGSDRGDDAGGRFNRFLKCRLIYWSFMNRKHHDPGEDDALIQPESVVNRVFRSAPHENHERQYRIFAEEINLLSDLSRWRTHTLEERTYRAFFLVDYSLYPELFDDEELFLLLQSNGFLEHIQEQKLKEGEVKNPLSPVISRLLEAEPSLSRELFDPQLIHRLDSPGLLPALIPTDTDSELLPVLADAVEHQIRFLLATDPSFSPDHFLYLISIRRPDKKFYQILAELSSSREYHHSRDGFYPLADICSYLAGGISNHSGKALTPFWNVVISMHDELHARAESVDPIELLGTIIKALKGTGVENTREGITLYDLLDIVQPASGPWYRRGSQPMTAQNGREVADRLTFQAAKAEEKSGKIRPEFLNDAFLVSESVQGLEHTLNLVREELVTLLDGSLSGLVEKLIEKCQALLREWERAYIEAATIAQKTDDDEERRTLLITFTANRENSAIRQAMFSLLFESEVDRCGNETDESWLKRFRLLEWAASQSGTRADAEKIWNNRLEELWQQLAEEAMERNAEARVVQLVRNNAFSGIRKGSAGRNVLESIKRWCFNRYDFHHAHQCNVEISGTRMGASVIRTFREYSGHFAKVWLALFVGVIFMFDFGDPWTELAEIGDVGGVFFAFIFGVMGTFLYVWTDLRKSTVHLSGDPFQWVSVFGRVSFFLVITLIYTVLVVSLFWYMFSGTDQVVHGEYAPLHLLSWTGFALFVGVFFGLLGKSD